MSLQFRQEFWAKIGIWNSSEIQGCKAKRPGEITKKVRGMNLQSLKAAISKVKEHQCVQEAERKKKT